MEKMTTEQKRKQAEGLRRGAESCRVQAKGERERFPTITGPASDVLRKECEGNMTRLEALAKKADADAAALESEVAGGNFGDFGGFAPTD